MRALLTDKWRYLRWNDGSQELYDRRSDPHDLYNLARRREYADVCQALQHRLEELEA